MFDRNILFGGQTPTRPGCRPPRSGRRIARASLPRRSRAKGGRSRRSGPLSSSGRPTRLPGPSGALPPFIACSCSLLPIGFLPDQTRADPGPWPPVEVHQSGSPPPTPPPRRRRPRRRHIVKLLGPTRCSASGPCGGRPGPAAGAASRPQRRRPFGFDHFCALGRGGAPADPGRTGSGPARASRLGPPFHRALSVVDWGYLGRDASSPRPTPD